MLEGSQCGDPNNGKKAFRKSGRRLEIGSALNGPDPSDHVVR